MITEPVPVLPHDTPKPSEHAYPRALLAVGWPPIAITDLCHAEDGGGEHWY